MPIKAVAGGFTFGTPTGSSPKRRRSVGQSSGGGGLSLSPTSPTAPSPILGGGSSKSPVRKVSIKERKGLEVGYARKSNDLFPQPKISPDGGGGRKERIAKHNTTPSPRSSPAFSYSQHSSSSPPPPSRMSPIRSPSRNLTSSRGGHKSSTSASPISLVRERATINPFDGRDASHISSFANAYNNRDLPCRLMHGSVTHNLRWETDIEHVQYDPLVVTFAEGLVETRHPYHFVARKGLKDLLTAHGAGARTVPLVHRLIRPIRATLVSRDADVYQGGITALVDLSHAVGAALNPHIKLLLGQLAKNAMKACFREQVTDVLNVLETNGGKECYKLIKAKIPTYCTVSIGQSGVQFDP